MRANIVVTCGSSSGRRWLRSPAQPGSSGSNLPEMMEMIRNRGFSTFLCVGFNPAWQVSVCARAAAAPGTIQVLSAGERRPARASAGEDEDK